jgi:hypothetical protein
MVKDTFSPMAGDIYAKPVQGALRGQPTQQTFEQSLDAFAAFFGFNTAPAWTGRSALANDIMIARDAEKGHMVGRSVEEQQQAQIKQNLRNAVLEGDRPAFVQAMQDGRAAGLSWKQLVNAARKADVTPDKYAFQQLSTDKELEFMRRMNHAEIVNYWPFTHKDAKARYRALLPRPLVTATQ